MEKINEMIGRFRFPIQYGRVDSITYFNVTPKWTIQPQATTLLISGIYHIAASVVLMESRLLL